MTIRIVDAGMLTTVQDLGRFGHQRDGVPVSGAMDSFAIRAANLLVGNDESDAALEMTMVGATVAFDEDVLVAITGADVGASVDGVPLARWRPARIRAGAMLVTGAARDGCRAYLAIAGGVDVPTVLGSRATYARAAMGGYEGRALARGDVLKVGERPALACRIAARLATSGARCHAAPWGVGPSIRPRYDVAPTVRLTPGAHLDALTAESRARLFGERFRISSRSDRMGYRLEGQTLALTAPLEPLSEAVTFGTVQLPPGGEPIVLMADRQTTGGYPRIGEVATVDLPIVAQLRPGDHVRFRAITVARAQALYLEREREIAMLARAILLHHA